MRYEVVRRRRRTIGISVTPEGAVEVHAPLRASGREIQEAVDRHRRWIEKRRTASLDRTRRLRARRFDDGDAIPYLGADLTLRLREIEGTPVVPPELIDDELWLDLRAGLSVASRRAVARHAVGRWLLERAGDVFHETHVDAARRVGRTACSVTIKDMTSRWGSCGPERKMSLSWRLIMAPLEVVDYVIVHELTHIIVNDHSPAFWRRVERACPDWRAQRDWLKEFGGDLEL